VNVSRICKSAKEAKGTDTVSEFLATLVGAAVGVVAGALIQYVAQLFLERRVQKYQRQALKKELQYNLQVVGDLERECTRLRNAVNSGTLGSYFGYLSFERAIWSQTNVLMFNGLLYRWFAIEALTKFQKVVAILSAPTSGWINSNIAQRRESAQKGEASDKVQLAAFVDHVENQINEARACLNDLLGLI
jgi:hypothetical protein